MVFPAAVPVHTTEQVTEQDGLVKDLVKELSDTQIKILNLVSEDKHITKAVWQIK